MKNPKWNIDVNIWIIVGIVALYFILGLTIPAIR
jgi:hypothetical protein